MADPGQILIAFWMRHPEPFIYRASARFGFLAEELRRYRKILHWPAISGNTSIEWTAGLIDEFREELTVINHPYTSDELEGLSEYGIGPLQFHGGLHTNRALPWTANFLEQHKSKFSWSQITQFPPVHVDLEILERFKERWDWFIISALYDLPFDTDLLEHYSGYWNYRMLFLNRTFLKRLEPAMMDLVREKDPWFYPIAEEIIKPEERKESSPEKRRFLYRFYTSRSPITNDELEYAMNRFSTTELVQFERTPWSPAFIDYFADQFNWTELCDGRDIPFSPALIEKYLDRISFGSPGKEEPVEIPIFEYSEVLRVYHPGLSANLALPWSEELIRKYKDRWYWPELSRNGALPWSASLIDAFIDRWDWEILSGSSSCLDRNMIMRYSDRLDWRALSANSYLNWSVELLETFRERWDYKAMCENEAIVENFITPLLTSKTVNDILSSNISG